MIEYTYYKQSRQVSSGTGSQVRSALLEHLQAYGDAVSDIQKYSNSALCRDRKPGGIPFAARDKENTTGTLTIHFTGMKGYIPGNSLVYLPVHNNYREQGIGKNPVEMALEHTDVSIVLRIEPNGPIKNYEKMDLNSKFLEMRPNKYIQWHI